MAFPAFRFTILHLTILTIFSNPSSVFTLVSVSGGSDFELDIDSEFLLFHQDYTPPAPPPPPPHPPSVSCEFDLGGIGSLDTTCEIAFNLNLSKNVYIAGKGNFVVLPNITINCSSFSGCYIAINVTGNFTLGENSAIIGGTFELTAGNASFGNGSSVDTTGLAGSPPPQTSGTPQGLDGAGGGYGGRGATCLRDTRKPPEDFWGGDPYEWSNLEKPWSYGSRGGTTSREVDYGGGGGGRVMLVIASLLEVNGTILADGGDGGTKGGGGSGGSIFIKAYKMIGIGRISACGGGGFAGGGGGRVAVDIYSRHDEPVIAAHGGSSLGCQENAGAAGTIYDGVTRSLTVSNHNKSTYTDTLLMEFPQLFLTNIYIHNQAKAAAPLLWSRVQVQGQISLLCGGVLSFGLAQYSTSEFELLAEELLMSDSIIRVFGALRMSVKIFLMWNSRMQIDGGGDGDVETSLLEASNLIVLKESSFIHSNANLGVHGQGLLNLSGQGDFIEAQRLVLSLFYSINIGPGSALRGPSQNASDDAVTPKLNCDSQDCPFELFHPPEDCNVNSSLSFTLQICRVEDILVQGSIEGSVVHFHRARTITVQSSGIISTSGMGCIGGTGQGKNLSSGIGSGAGHGGMGGMGCYNGSCVEGGISYGDADLPCELGSGSGTDSSAGSTAGGGILVMGSWEQPLIILSVEGSVRADGDSFRGSLQKKNFVMDGGNIGPGGGSGGTVLLFLHTLILSESGILSSVGGHGSPSGGGGGGGGRIHFHWSDIPTGDIYQQIASVNGTIHTGGGLGGIQGYTGGNGTVSGKACPKGLYGIFCEECPTGTYKNVTGSARSLCFPCPSSELPRRAVYIYVRGGITETPCPYKCASERYHMPNCYTALEELIHTFGGPWLFGLLLLGLLILLALVLSVARMKFIGVDELPGPAPTQQGSQIDHSFPFLESLNEVLETNRVEESQSHVHRMYFIGPNTFSKPWLLPHTPPEQIKEIVYEGAYNTFVDEINALAAYQWWEGSVHSILCILAYPLAWSWQQWRRKMKLQRLREFVRSEYDHACLRSCRSRALYEGLKVAATPDLMLAYVDFFLGGDEKRSDLPPPLCQRFPMSLLFGGDGSYMTPFSLHNDKIITNLMSQSMPPTTWFRFVAGLNAQLRLVHRGCLRAKFRPVLKWLETFANPALRIYGVRVDLAWFRATNGGYCHYGLLVYAVEEEMDYASLEGRNGADEQHLCAINIFKREETYPSQTWGSTDGNLRRKAYGSIVDVNSLNTIEEKREIFFALSFLIHNSKPVGHQDLVGLVVSILLLGDFSLVLLTLLQLYSLSLADVLLVLCILPLGILLPFPAGINALFSHGPRRSAGLARVYALWNITSFINIGVAFICGCVHYSSQSSRKNPYFQPWNMDEGEWWIFPFALLLCKCIQLQLINWHVANLEIQDRSLYSKDFDFFWQS
ncbi:glycine-rich protein [Forsythia ovata]|uniref:Glycine-rich protein n=1 Tax=Forsythia ovata TaxID=205694 RepID=A0ABD1W1Q6_9LAMI